MGRDLDLSNTYISSLPEGLTVVGNLSLCNTRVTTLPKQLTVGGNLDLRGTNITVLPQSLKLGGEVIGADIDPEQVKRAKQRYVEAFGEAWA